jgi:hypothetical protein
MVRHMSEAVGGRFMRPIIPFRTQIRSILQSMNAALNINLEFHLPSWFTKQPYVIHDNHEEPTVVSVESDV